jgi:hypothetical protein
MADTNYDQASRYLAKEAGGPMTLWLLGLTAEQIRCDSLEDSVLVLPGKERRCDLIARLADLTRGGVPCAAIIEFQIAPDPEMFGRLLIAGGMAWLQLRPTKHQGDRYDLIAVVVNLTGKGDCSRSVVVGTAEWKLIPREINLETLDASKVLDEIEAGTAPKVLLAWIPLMKNGNEDAIIERWLRIVSAEPDLKKRGDYALAAVFAQAVGKRDLWVRRIGGLTMIDTPLVLGWKTEGMIRALLSVLRAKYSSLPREVEERIEDCHDAAKVDQWVVTAATTDTLDKFRQATGL